MNRPNARIHVVTVLCNMDWMFSRVEQTHFASIHVDMSALEELLSGLQTLVAADDQWRSIIVPSSGAPLSAAPIVAQLICDNTVLTTHLLLYGDDRPDVMIEGGELLGARFTPSLTTIPAWVQWNGTNPESLLTLLLALRTAYIASIKPRIISLNNDLITYEVNMLASEASAEYSVEVQNRDVVVGIRVPCTVLDFRESPLEVASVNIEMVVDASNPSSSPLRRSGARVELAPNVADLIGSPTLPRFHRESGVADYVSAVSTALKSSRDRIVQLRERRGDFIMSIASAYRRHLSEVDSAGRSFVSLMWSTSRASYHLTARFLPDGRLDLVLVEIDDVNVEPRVIPLDTSSFNVDHVRTERLGWFRALLSRYCVSQ